jgi:hypothetical protein
MMRGKSGSLQIGSSGLRAAHRVISFQGKCIQDRGEVITHDPPFMLLPVTDPSDFG